MRYEEMTEQQRKEYGFVPLSPGIIEQLEWRRKGWEEQQRKQQERDKKARLWATSKRLLEMAARSRRFREIYR